MLADEGSGHRLIDEDQMFELIYGDGFGAGHEVIAMAYLHFKSTGESPPLDTLMNFDLARENFNTERRAFNLQNIRAELYPNFDSK